MYHCNSLPHRVVINSTNLTTLLVRIEGRREGLPLAPKRRTLFELYMEKHKRKPEYPLVVNIYATGITVGEPNAIM